MKTEKCVCVCVCVSIAGEFTPGKYGEWRFDKRSYGGRPIPRNLGPPPANMKNDLVRFLINAFNEATDAIPCWPEYEKTGKVRVCVCVCVCVCVHTPHGTTRAKPDCAYGWTHIMNWTVVVAT